MSVPGVVIPTFPTPPPLVQKPFDAPGSLSGPFVLLFYGVSGTQKTRLAAQAPDPIFLSCDEGRYGGLVSAREFNPKQAGGGPIKNFSEYLRLLPRLQSEAGKTFKTIVLDSITGFQQIILRDVCASTGREVPQLNDWGLIVTRLRTAINTLASMNAHLIITATEQLLKDEFTGRILGRPNVAGKLAEELPQGVDINLHLFTRGMLNLQGKRVVNYLFSTQPDDMWAAKDRLGILDAEMPTTGASIARIFNINSKTEGGK